MTPGRTAQESFGAVAKEYLTSQAHARPYELHALVARVGKTVGTVVDVGTGAGHTAFAFAPYATNVIAYDLTPQMLEVVEEEAKARGLPNIVTRLGDAEQLPFEDGSIAGVTCRMAAHHFHHPTAFVAEAARVLMPGGFVLLIDTVSPEDQATAMALDSIERRRDPSHVWNLNPSEWRSAFEANGLELEWETLLPKPIEIQPWLSRMRVPMGEGRALVKDIMESSGLLRDYLNPVEREGSSWFSLSEYTGFCRKYT